MLVAIIIRRLIMFKKVISIAMALCLLIACAGCAGSSSKAYTFHVDNGESVKIKLDTSDKYDLTSEVPFTITQDGETLSQGTFILGESFEQYAAVVEEDEEAELLDSGTVDGIEFIFWAYNEAEFNYAILLEGGNTGILLGNTVSEESAREVFARLTFSVEE